MNRQELCKSSILAACVKLKKLVGMLYQKFSLYANPYVMARLYVSQIRPHLEYGAQVWHPHLATEHSCPGKGAKICIKNMFTKLAQYLWGTSSDV